MNFVTPGYQWPMGQERLYLCRSSCKAKIQQGADKAADLTKMVNDLRAEHFNQPTSVRIEILPAPAKDSPPIDSLDLAEPQTRQSQLGRRKVPCELPSTPEVRIPKIVGDAQGVSKKDCLMGPHNVRCYCGSYTKCDKGRIAFQLELHIILLISPLQVTHLKGTKTRRFTLNSPYKGIAKCMRYKNPSYTVRTMLRVPSLKRATLTEIATVSG